MFMQCACFSPSFHWVLICAYHGRMAHTETWVPGAEMRWFTRPKTVTHSGTNRAWRIVTMLIESNTLSLS